jgi:hypothetical protein
VYGLSGICTFALLGSMTENAAAIPRKVKGFIRGM